MTGRSIGAGMTLAACLLAGACSRATVLNPSPNDALRAENQALRERVDRLTLQVKELEARAAERTKVAPPPTASANAEVEAATPRVAGVAIEGASEAVLTGAGPASPATLRLWISPRDGRGRFLQVVGSLAVGVAILRAGEAPVEVARANFGPAAIRDAWRSGVLGSHYAFEVPLSIPADLRTLPLTVSIRFDDAVTGQSFEDERRLAAPRDGTATLTPVKSSQ